MKELTNRGLSSFCDALESVSSQLHRRLCISTLSSQAHTCRASPTWTLVYGLRWSGVESSVATYGCRAFLEWMTNPLQLKSMWFHPSFGGVQPISVYRPLVSQAFAFLLQVRVDMKGACMYLRTIPRASPRKAGLDVGPVSGVLVCEVSVCTFETSNPLLDNMGEQ